MIDLKKVQKLIYALLTIVAAHDQDPEKTLATYLQGIDIFEFEGDLSTLEAILLKMQGKNPKEENQLSFLNSTILSLTKLIQAKDISEDFLIKEIDSFFIHLSTLFKTQENTLCSLKNNQEKCLYTVFGLLKKPGFFFPTPTPNSIGQTIIQSLRAQCNIHFIPEMVTANFFTIGSLRLPTDTISLDTQSVSPTRSVGSVISVGSSPPKSLFEDDHGGTNSENYTPTTQTPSDLRETLENPISHPRKEKPSLFFIQNSNPSLEAWPQWPLDEQSSPRSSIPIVNYCGKLTLARIQ